MSDPQAEFRKYIADHFIVVMSACAAVIVPLIIYIVSEYKSLNEARVVLERDKATAHLEIGRARLEVERIGGQHGFLADSTKQLLGEIAAQQQQIVADRKQLQEAWRNVESWRQKLNQDQEFKNLSDDFTALGIDLKRCVPVGELEKYQRARILAERIWYAAAQTSSPANQAFAKGIQPQSTQPFGCPRSNAP